MMLSSGHTTSRAAPHRAVHSRHAALHAQTVRGRTAAAGATDTNQLVALPDFYARHIAPELAAPDANDRAITKADALKFLTTFRGQARAGRGLQGAALRHAPGGLLSDH